MKYWHFTYWQNDYAILKFDFPAQLTFLPDVTSFFVGWSRYTKSARRRRVFSPAPDPIHTNSPFLVIFEELPFCHFPPLNTSILGKDSNLVDLSFEYLSFLNKRKTSILFPSPLTFLQLPMVIESSRRLVFNGNSAFRLWLIFILKCYELR